MDYRTLVITGLEHLDLAETQEHVSLILKQLAEDKAIPLASAEAVVHETGPIKSLSLVPSPEAVIVRRNLAILDRTLGADLVRSAGTNTATYYGAKLWHTLLGHLVGHHGETAGAIVTLSMRDAAST